MVRDPSSMGAAVGTGAGGIRPSRASSPLARPPGVRGFGAAAPVSDDPDDDEMDGESSESEESSLPELEDPEHSSTEEASSSATSTNRDRGKRANLQNEPRSEGEVWLEERLRLIDEAKKNGIFDAMGVPIVDATVDELWKILDEQQKAEMGLSLIHI